MIPECLDYYQAQLAFSRTAPLHRERQRQNDAASETRKNDLKTKLSPPFDSNNTITFRAARSRLALQKQALGRA